MANTTFNFNKQSNPMSTTTQATEATNGSSIEYSNVMHRRLRSIPAHGPGHQILVAAKPKNLPQVSATKHAWKSIETSTFQDRTASPAQSMNKTIIDFNCRPKQKNFQPEFSPTVLSMNQTSKAAGREQRPMQMFSQAVPKGTAAANRRAKAQSIDAERQK